MKDAAYLLRLAVGVYSVVLSNYFVCIVTFFYIVYAQGKGNENGIFNNKKDTQHDNGREHYPFG